MTEQPLSVLMLTSEWPRSTQHTSHFVVRQARFLERAGVRVRVFPFRGAKRPLNYLRAWRQVRRLLAREHFDLVHAQFGQSALIAFPKRRPLVVTFRGDDLLGIVGDDCRPTRAGRILQRLSRFVARRADAAIVVSEHMRERLTGAALPVHVIPSGIDFDLFRPIPQGDARAHLGLPAGERLVLFVGDPAESRKRFALAERAVAILSGTMPARLLVGWNVPHEDIPYYMGAADALVFTSMQEGSPNAVKEALACNLPVVSVPVGDVALRLQGIVGCELVSDERPEAIARALGRVLDRGQRIAGRDAVRHLDEQVLAQQVIGIYRAVVRPGQRLLEGAQQSCVAS
jgi:teichuronic acid biosynthesis glycosyltransferase TuaC